MSMGIQKTVRKKVPMRFSGIFVVFSFVLPGVLAVLSGNAYANGGDWDKWKATQIEDALSAAPPSVTGDATLYAWQDDGKLVLLRHGSGPHVCFATGQLSLRVGLPRPPFPDPMCMDPNAWAFFFRSVGREKSTET